MNGNTRGIINGIGCTEVASYSIDHGYDVVLNIQDDGLFLVQYGFETKVDLDYKSAAAKLGEYLMHQLQCAGRLDRNVN